MAILTRTEFEETVRRRATSSVALKTLDPMLAFLKEQHGTLEVEAQRTAENARLFKASDDPRADAAKGARDAAKAAFAEKGKLLAAEIKRLMGEIKDHRQIIDDADVEIETTRQVLAAFGEGE